MRRHGHPGAHYDNRACLALCLAIMQGMPCGQACHMAGTRASVGAAPDRVRPHLVSGSRVIWSDRKRYKNHPAIVLNVRDRVKIRVLTPGCERKLWVAAHRLAVAGNCALSSEGGANE